MTEKTASIGVPDLIEHKDQLLGEIHKLKGFESVTIDQVINGTTGIPQEKLLLSRAARIVSVKLIRA